MTKLYQRIFPGQTLGVLGGGQLGRMFAQSAQAMGYRVVVLDPSKESPAAAVADEHICSAYDDHHGLTQLQQRTQAITTEFENVPAQSLKQLSLERQVSPMAAAVAVAQDRIAEKSFIAAQGIDVAPHAVIRNQQDLEDAIKRANSLLPGIMKVARLGYDGKGQVRIRTIQEAREAFALLNAPCVWEAMLPLEKEVSLVLARGFDGEKVFYPVVENTHVEGILATTWVNPLGLSPILQEQARQAASNIADSLNYVGVLCVEFFVLQDGALVVNEIAPRPHNSGHYTQNACVCSQFEQQVRAMTGMPLGSTELLGPCVMMNILGDSWFVDQASERVEPDWSSVLALPGVSLHLYGKREPRVGRKMGHVNILASNPEQLRGIAHQVADILNLKHKP